MNKINSKTTNSNIKIINENYFNVNKIINEKTKQIELLNQIINEKNETIKNITNSQSWKIIQSLRYILNKIKNSNTKININTNFLSSNKNKFEDWIQENNIISNIEKKSILKKLNDWSNDPNQLPLISIIMPTYNPNINWFVQAIESVRNQIYPNWQLCIADDASTDSKVIELLEQYSNKDSRIEFISRKKNGHISAASNSALELVKGNWIALLDHDDLITEDALFWIVSYINKNPNVKLLYSDEAKTNEHNELLDPYFKSDWNFDLFYGHNMICHLGVYKTEVIKEINGYRLGYEGAQDYDLALRFIEKINSSEIIHIPKILYYWRIHSNSTAGSADAKPYAEDAGANALNDHFKRTKIQATTTPSKYGYLTHYNLPTALPSATIIIRFPDFYYNVSLSLIINDIINNTDYKNFNILIVSANETLINDLTIPKEQNKIELMLVDKGTNLSSSELLKKVVERVNNQVLVFFDPKAYLKNSNWLEILISNAIRSEIGAVGPKLFYPDDTIYSTGLVLGLNNFADSLYKHQAADYNGYMSKAQLAQNISAVSLKCLAVEKHKLVLSQALDVSFNFELLQEINLCLSLSSHLFRTLWTPLSEAYYFESNLFIHHQELENDKYQHLLAKETEYLKYKWKNYFDNDPFYNPNLSLTQDNCTIANKSRFLKNY